MENSTNKSFEHKITVDGNEHLVRAVIVSLPEDAEIENIDTEANKGYIFNIALSIQPDLPKNLYDKSIKNLVFVVGNGGENQLGYLNGNRLVELEDSLFVTALHATIFEVLAVSGDTGHFIV